MAKDQEIIVIAAQYRQILLWCNRENIPPGRVLKVTEARHLYGLDLKDARIVIIDSPDRWHGISECIARIHSLGRTAEWVRL